jgi:hypothetical protein
MGTVTADPSLTVYDSSSQIVGQNDNWSAGVASATTAVVSATVGAGTFPLPANSLDAAALLTLGPGPYTVHARGPASTTGVVLTGGIRSPVIPAAHATGKAKRHPRFAFLFWKQGGVADPP